MLRQHFGPSPLYMDNYCHWPFCDVAIEINVFPYICKPYISVKKNIKATMMKKYQNDSKFIFIIDIFIMVASSMMMLLTSTLAINC